METSPILQRPKDGAVVAGVCAGLGRRWQVDPKLLRIAVIVLSLAGGLGVVAYGAAALLIPRVGSADMPIRSLLPFTRSWPTPALVAAVGVAGALLVAALGGWSGAGLGPILVVAAVWYFGLHRQRTVIAPARPSSPTPFDRAAEAWRQRLLEQRTLTESPRTIPMPISPLPTLSADAWVPAGAAAPIPAIPTVTRRRGWLWLVALALAAAGLGVVALLDRNGVTASPVAYWAAVLAALGLTLVAATRVGRPPAMVLATVLTGLAMTSAMVPASPGLAEVGDVQQSYSSAADLPAEVSVGLGEVTLDLADLTLAADAATTVRVGAGTATLILPTEVNSEVVWTVKAGEYHSSGQERSGIDLSGLDTYTPHPGGPVLRVVASVEAGTLEVIR